MKGRNDQDCLAASIAWLTGEDINVLPSDFFADMYVRDGSFCRAEGWPKWFRHNGYKYRVRLGKHYKGLHVANYWIIKPDWLHTVICEDDIIVYNCSDFYDEVTEKLEMKELFSSMKIYKKG